MNTASAFQALLDTLKRFWPSWNLHVCILISLLAQVILLILAPLRKWTTRKAIFIIVWIAYLLSDWTATIGIGLILKNEGSTKVDDLLPLWASFFLLHLGGPDTITSFAIADNLLWLRHLTKVLTAASIIYLSFSEDKMRISTIAVFVAGTIKYSERTRALFLASLERLGRSVLPEPDPGPNYEEAVNIYASKSAVHVPTTKEKTPTVRAADKATEEKGQTIDMQSEIKLMQAAYRFFESFKGLTGGYLLSSRVRRSSRRYFLARTAKEAFRLVAYELNFIYDVLHTKNVVVRTRSGYVHRCFCIIALLVGLFQFRSLEKKYRAEYIQHVLISYTLFFGALGLEAMNVLMLICSDWTIIKLKSRWSKFYPKFILSRQRWSMSFSRYDIISYCLNRPPDWLCELAKFAHVEELLDNINSWRYSYRCGVEDQLQELIFQKLKKKGKDAETLQAGIEACKQRGDGTLLLEEYDHLQWSIKEYQYAESLLLWHIATEIHYHTSPGGNGKEICKQISDYMFSLLLLKPPLMTLVLGNWQMAFQDTCAEAMRFFEGKNAKEPEKACKEAVNVRTPCRPAAVKGSKSNSVFFDAILLVKQLSEVPGSPWTLMSEVWMELMSYAAINCTPNEHVWQLSTGGELLTIIWLLMNHFGLGTQFYENEVGTRTTMIRLRK